MVIVVRGREVAWADANDPGLVFDFFTTRENLAERLARRGFCLIERINHPGNTMVRIVECFTPAALRCFDVE